MAVAERIQDAVGTVIDRQGMKPPPIVQDRLKRGEDRLKEIAPYRDECWAFWRGEQYAYVNAEKYLVKQQTVTNQDPALRHRVRRTFNLLTPVIGHKVSASTSRIPDYEINPTTYDPEDVHAARLAKKVAQYGYDEWDVRRVSVETVTRALVADEGFAWPFFDTSIGPFVQDDQGSVGVGDVRIRTFGPNEVFWEPGVSFEESRWHAVKQAVPIEELKQLEGYMEGDLKEDAEGKSKVKNSKLAMRTDYLERPSAKKPQGRWLTIASGRQIVPAKSYPCQDHQGNVLDEPVLHKLSFITDPESDRDMGLGRFMLDPQRVFNRANCTQSEWLQMALNPQGVVKNGKLRQKVNDIPGFIYEYWGGGDFEWKPVPPIPPELQQIKDDARSVMQFIAADQDIPTGIEAGRAIEALIERDSSVWAEFNSNLAEWHSRLMRHCLYLVQRFYDEPRLLQIRGDFGVDPIEDFQGANLRGQADVTVFPGSIEPRTRKDIEAKVFGFADRGWITPEQAMSAIEQGNAAQLVKSFELDESRATRIIQQIRRGPDVLFSGPQVVVGLEPDTVPGPPDPVTAQPTPMPNPRAGQPKEGPNWMPRYSDNIRIWKSTFDDWFKTEEYEQLDRPMQEAAGLVYHGILQVEAQKQQDVARAQEAVAAQQGLENAARPQANGKSPDNTAVSSMKDSGVPTQNQPADQSPGPHP